MPRYDSGAVVCSSHSPPTGHLRPVATRILHLTPCSVSPSHLCCTMPSVGSPREPTVPPPEPTSQNRDVGHPPHFGEGHNPPVRLNPLHRLLDQLDKPTYGSKICNADRPKSRSWKA